MTERTGPAQPELIAPVAADFPCVVRIVSATGFVSRVAAAQLYVEISYLGGVQYTSTPKLKDTAFFWDEACEIEMGKRDGTSTESDERDQQARMSPLVFTVYSRNSVSSHIVGVACLAHENIGVGEVSLDLVAPESVTVIGSLQVRVSP
jgi:hypothetical protein